MATIETRRRALVDMANEIDEDEARRPRHGEDASAAVKAHAGVPRTVSLLKLFLLFSQLGLSSFGGGVSAWIRRSFVERRGWSTETQFAAALALARIMPGANVINLAILIGQRARGIPGAIVAVLGLVVGPTLGVIALAVLYRRFAGAEILHSMLEG